jgi:CheY-like chemotaxis protein
MPKSKTDQRAESKSKKKKILIADESITIQKLVNLTFADRSVEVITASDGPDAMIKVKRLQPDIVLADAHLRQVDGVELCENIRADTKLRTIFVVLLKGHVDKEFEKRIETVRFDEIISKPFDSKVLAEVVDRFLMDEESTVVKGLGPFSRHSSAQKKLEAAEAEVYEENSEAETVTKKIETEEKAKEESITKRADPLPSNPSPIQEISESSVTIKAERLRPSRDEAEFQEPLVVKAQSDHRTQALPPETKVDPTALEKLGRQMIQEWIEKEMPSIAEKMLKDEITRLTSTS